jgi:predicted Fe-S protein YdhL (DUF1289 family)
MTFIARPQVVDSPCNRICTVDPTSGLCIGCGRSLDEIAGWLGYSESERRRITAELPARLAALRAADAKPAGSG